MTVAVMPAFPLLALSNDERSLVTRLNNLRSVALPQIQLRDAYYNGVQVIRDLGIAIPPQVRGLSTVVGWPQIAVDALDERLEVQGFRYSSSPTGDDTLWGIWQDNNLDEESQLAHLDSLVHRASFAAVGTNDDGSPLITVESMYDMSVLWDPRWKAITAALRVYGGDEYGRHRQATLYLPNQNIYVGQNDSGEWVLDDGNVSEARDFHNLDEVTVARLANRQRTSAREGNSEITSQIMSITDSACRTLLGLEVSREFFIAPKLILLGATESAFVGPDGTPKSPWQTYIGRILGLERDENGDLPQVHQLAQMDPSAFTKIMDIYRQEMSSLTRLPPYMLGETTQNPASADAIRSAENGLIKRAERRQKAFSGAWETVMRLALRVTNGGRLPADASRIETIWAPAQTPTPGATADALTKYTAAGILPPISDVTRERAGFSPEERARLREEDKLNVTEELVAAVAKSLEAKGLRTFKAVEADAGTPASAAPTNPLATP